MPPDRTGNVRMASSSPAPAAGQKQTADIVVNGFPRGVVEIVYVEQKPKLDEGPFLKEERNLIDEFAGQVALIIERRQAGHYWYSCRRRGARAG